MRHPLLPTLPLGLLLGCTLAVTGCASDAGDADATASDDITGASDDYARTLSEVDRDLAECEASGRCARVATAGIDPLGAASGPAPKGPTSVRSVKLCEALKPLAPFESPYFFAGANANASAITTLADGGVDLVYDLNNMQTALFHYHSHGYSNLVGAEVTAYVGYGFGKKKNVLDAWGGDFQTAEASVDVPFLKLSAGGNIFRAPDNSIWGGAIEASIGFNLLGPLGVVEVSVSEGNWTPWDGATQNFAKTLAFVTHQEKTAVWNGKRHTYIQYASARDLAFSLVQTLHSLAFVPAAQAVALAVLKQRHLTITQVCK